MEQLQIVMELLWTADRGEGASMPSTKHDPEGILHRGQGNSDQKQCLPDVGESDHHDERRLLERQRLDGGEPWHGARQVFDSSPFSAFSLGILV